MIFLTIAKHCSIVPRWLTWVWSTSEDNVLAKTRATWKILSWSSTSALAVGGSLNLSPMTCHVCHLLTWTTSTLPTCCMNSRVCCDGKDERRHPAVQISECSSAWFTVVVKWHMQWRNPCLWWWSCPYLQKRRNIVSTIVFCQWKQGQSHLSMWRRPRMISSQQQEGHRRLHPSGMEMNRKEQAKSDHWDGTWICTESKIRTIFLSVCIYARS